MRLIIGLRRRGVKKLHDIKDVRTYKNNLPSAPSVPKPIAVVLHLYYPEMWEYFKTQLARLSLPYDLYLTVPASRLHLVPKAVLDDRSNHIFVVPNRGRDVLPFIMLARAIADLPYRAVLKLHTKKSPHFSGGRAWLEDVVVALTKINTEHVVKAFDEGVRVVGPKGHYYSLEVNFEANGKLLDKILAKSFSRPIIYETTQSQRRQHGFFGGSMAWYSMDYLRHKTFQWQPSVFEIESAQVDGTFAHALERALTLVCEIEKQPIAETDGKKIVPRPYNNGLIPEWSDKYYLVKEKTS